MQLSGEYRIAAPKARVWEALNDPDVLKASIPGTESLEKIDDTTFEGVVAAKVGPVRAKFSGTVTLSDMNPPDSYRISGEGKGGVAGFAKGSAQVNLEEDGPEATKLAYEADAQVGGKLAQIGSRLIQGTAKKMANEFFTEFAAQVEKGHAGQNSAPEQSQQAEAGAPAAEPSQASADRPAPADSPAGSATAAATSKAPSESVQAPEKGESGRIAPIYWVVAVLAILILLLLVTG